MNDLIIIDNTNPLEVFKPEKVTDIIERVRAEVEAFVGDPTTEKGRAEIASFTMKIRKTKTGIDELGKNLVSEWKEKSKLVDNERKRVRDELDLMIEKTYRPVQEFRDREEKRLQEHKDKLALFSNFVVLQETSEQITQRIEFFTDMHSSRDWQEFKDVADSAFENTLAQLRNRLDACLKAEQDVRELAELKAKQAEQERIERENRVAQEAAERAEAEARAKVEREKQELIAMARKAEEDKARELQQQQDRHNAELKAIEDKKIEEQRIEKLRQDEENKRIADENHRKQIQDDILELMEEIAYDAIDVEVSSRDIAKAIARAIFDNAIPNLIVRY